MSIEAPARAIARALGIALFTAATAASLLPAIALASTPNHQACSNDDQEPEYRITNVDVQHISGLRKKTMTVQAGPDPLDRFFVHRVSRVAPAHPLRGVILVLPPLGSGFQNYEVSEDGDYAGSFVGFFASRGYDVWGYSQRVQGITSGSCESGRSTARPWPNGASRQSWTMSPSSAAGSRVTDPSPRWPSGASRSAAWPAWPSSTLTRTPTPEPS